MKTEDEILIASEERIRIPGVRYDKVYMYSQSLSSEARAAFSQIDNYFDHRWERSSLETLEDAIQLYPAHHADLNVALWYQVEGNPSENKSFTPYLTFVFHYKGKRVKGIVFDIYERIVWPEGGRPIYLTTEATNRIRTIMHELEDDFSVRHSRGATLFVNPTNGFGTDVVARSRETGEVLVELKTSGPYRSAADEFNL